MKIYKDEQDISSVLDNRTIAYSVPILDIKHETVEFHPVIDGEEIMKAAIKDKELYYHTSILVTTNWNKNDDIFAPETVWAARNTPVDKPTNLDHDNNKIVGHITGSWAIDTDGKIIEEN